MEKPPPLSLSYQAKQTCSHTVTRANYKTKPNLEMGHFLYKHLGFQPESV